MTETIKRKLSDSSAARWTAMLIVSFTMMCGYFITDVMSPLGDMLTRSVVDGGMADGFAHDGAFAHDGVVSHEGLVKAPSGYHHVNGYTRIAPDGHTEYVHDYIRSNPDGILENNLSYHGNHPVVEGTYQALPGEAAHVPASTGHSLYVMLAGGMKSGWRVVANIGRHTLITLFLVYTAVFLVTGIVV